MSVLPASKHFKIWKGSTFYYRFQYLQNNSSTPIDLTGYTGTLIIKNLADTQTYLIITDVTQQGLGSTRELLGAAGMGSVSANGSLAFGGVNGTVDITILAGATSGFTWTTGHYELLVSDRLGNIIPLLTGGIGVIGL